jgi:murein L,D-transpeptidase YafK
MKSIFSFLMCIFLVTACGLATKEKEMSGLTVDRLVLEKSKRQLHLLSNGKIIKTYKVSLGKNPVGHKTREGDGKTPEGTYLIDRRNAKSAYHLSLHLSYPSAEEIKQAQISGVSPGGDIMIHGLPNGFGFLAPFHHFKDWTQGCIAVTNKEIEEIWNNVSDGTIIIIKP